MFDENSMVVQAWVKAVQKGDKTLDDVPFLSNLRNVVIKIIKGGNKNV